jgi:hypothetical protein
LALFNGRMTDLPEKVLHPNIASTGRCEVMLTFFGKNILCFMEFKETPPTDAERYSDVVAQGIAEMDGADTHNGDKEYDGCTIHSMLTDGYSFEFYRCDFKMWTIHRRIWGHRKRSLPKTRKGLSVLDPYV